MLTLLLVCAFSPRKYKSILRGFYNKDSLPGDCHATLAMTEYFVRNRIRVCLLERNIKNSHTFFIILRAAHFMSLRAKRGNLPEGHHIKAMCLRRDVCLRHVAVSLRVRLPRIQKQPRLRLFFGVPGGSRTLDTRRRRPVLYPTELRIRL